jgi:DNA recombination protein RmuC
VDPLPLLALLAALLAAVLVGALVGAALRGRGGRASAGPSDPAQLRPLLDELTRGAVAEALGTSGVALTEQLRQAVEDRLRTQQEAAEAQGRATQDALRRVVEPLQEGVARLDAQVRELEQVRAEAFGRLDTQVASTARTLEALQVVTGRLDGAMRSNVTRGQWGELQLQRIVELVGLKEHVSYVAQAQQAGEGRAIPDLTVLLTDGKVLYVDAKAPMVAFLRALDTEDPDAQREHLVQHARDLLGHVRALAARGYLDDGASIDLMALFVPNEAALAAALEADPTLLTRALELRIVVTGPTSLAMLLTNISASWRQQRMADNAERIVGEALELHRRLGSFVAHLAKVGTHLARSVGSFNDAVGSFERRLLPATRRIEALAAVADKDRLEDLSQIETIPTLTAPADGPGIVEAP